MHFGSGGIFYWEHVDRQQKNVKKVVHLRIVGLITAFSVANAARINYLHN